MKLDSPISGSKDFRIRFDSIVRGDISNIPNWRKHPVVQAMAGMLPKKTIETLFEEFIANEPTFEAELEQLRKLLFEAKKYEESESDEQLRMRDHARKEIRKQLESDLFYDFGKVPNQLYYIEPHMYEGVNLSQPFDVQVDNPNYPILFTFRLSNRFARNETVEFLEFHLRHTFKGDKKKYKLFLLQLPIQSFPNIAAFLNEWIRQRTNKKKRGNKQRAKLSDYFDSQDLIKDEILRVFKDLPDQSTKRKGKNLNAIRVGLTLRDAINDKRPKKILVPGLCDLLVEIGIISNDARENFLDYLRRPKERKKYRIPDLYTFLKGVID